MRCGSALIVLVILAGRAEAHDVRGEALILDVGDAGVAVELHVPLAQLALARGKAARVLLAEPLAELADEVSLTTPGGQPFARAVDRVDVRGEELVYALRFAAPQGASPGHFVVRDELVLGAVINANVFVFSRRALATGELLDAPTLVGGLHYQQRALEVAASPPARAGVLASSWPWLAALCALGALGVFVATTRKDLT